MVAGGGGGAPPRRHPMSPPLPPWTPAPGSRPCPAVREPGRASGRGGVAVEGCCGRCRGGGGVPRRRHWMSPPLPLQTPATGSRPCPAICEPGGASGRGGGAVEGGGGAARGGRGGHLEDPTECGGGPRGFVPRPPRWLGDLPQPSVLLSHGPRGARGRWRAVAGAHEGRRGVGLSAPWRRHQRSPLLPPPTPVLPWRHAPALGETRGASERSEGGWRRLAASGEAAAAWGGVADLHCDMALRRVFAPQHPCLAPDDLLPFSGLPQQKASGGEWPAAAGEAGVSEGGVECADLHCNMALRRAFAQQLPRLAPDDLLPFCGLPQQKASGGECPVAFGGAVVSGTGSS